jgi:C1A family cysteine protease
MIKLIRNLFTRDVTKGIKVKGWRPDPPSSEDKRFALIQPKLSAVSSGVVTAIDLRSYCSVIENQQTSNSCVAQATVGALELLENVQGLPFVDLARLYVYYNARLAMAESHLEEGTHPRLAMASLSSLGVCKEETWSFQLDKITTRPSWKAYREGFTHKINGYYKIIGTGTGRVDQIKQALKAKHPVVFGVKVYANFIQ